MRNRRPFYLPKQKPKPLTKRQTQILQLVAGGASNQEAADVLGISESSVRNHLWRVAGKYNKSGRVAIVYEGIRRGDVNELLAYEHVEARRRTVNRGVFLVE